MALTLMTASVNALQIERMNMKQCLSSKVLEQAAPLSQLALQRHLDSSLLCSRVEVINDSFEPRTGAIAPAIYDPKPDNV